MQARLVFEHVRHVILVTNLSLNHVRKSRNGVDPSMGGLRARVSAIRYRHGSVEFAVLLVHFRYEEQLKERESQLQKEDLSDMVAEHAAKQKVSVT